MNRVIGCRIRFASSIRLALVMIYGIISLAVHYHGHDHSDGCRHSMVKFYGVSFSETPSGHEDQDSVCMVCQWLNSSNHHVTKLNPHFVFIPAQANPMRLEYIGNTRKYHSATTARGPPKA